MDILQILSWIFALIFIICSFTGIGMIFYLGREKVKKIDLLVYGYEIPHDSIFYKIQRVPTYGGAFAWYWGAKRSKLLKIRDHFDKQFQKPFIITFWLMMIGLVSMVLGIAFDHVFLNH